MPVSPALVLLEADWNVIQQHDLLLAYRMERSDSRKACRMSATRAMPLSTDCHTRESPNSPSWSTRILLFSAKSFSSDELRAARLSTTGMRA